MKCIEEAKRFIKLAEEVPMHETDFGKDFKGKEVHIKYIESGKASGLMKAQSIIAMMAIVTASGFTPDELDGFYEDAHLLAHALMERRAEEVN